MKLCCTNCYRTFMSGQWSCNIHLGVNNGKGSGKKSSFSSEHRVTQTYVQIPWSKLCTQNVIRGSVHLFGLLNVHFRRTTFLDLDLSIYFVSNFRTLDIHFSFSLYRCSHQGSTPSHQCHYLSSLFSYCIQNDVTFQCLSKNLGYKKPRPLLLIFKSQSRACLLLMALLKPVFQLNAKSSLKGWPRQAIHIHKNLTV